jgi:hypothetical protein
MKYQTVILPIFAALLGFAKAAPIASDTDASFFPNKTGWGCPTCRGEDEISTQATRDVDDDFFPQQHTGWGKRSPAIQDVDHEFEPQPEIGWGKRSPTVKDVDHEFEPQPEIGWGKRSAEAAAKDTDEEFDFQPDSGWGKRSA